MSAGQATLAEAEAVAMVTHLVRRIDRAERGGYYGRAHRLRLELEVAMDRLRRIRRGE